MSRFDQQLAALVSRVRGLCTVFATDKDGVLLSSGRHVPSYSANALAAAPGFSQESLAALYEGLFSAAFAMAADQSSKLGIGANKSITAFYKGFVVVHVNFHPLVLSFVFSAENEDVESAVLPVGLVHDIVPMVKEILKPVLLRVQQELASVAS